MIKLGEYVKSCFINSIKSSVTFSKDLIDLTTGKVVCKVGKKYKVKHIFKKIDKLGYTVEEIIAGEVVKNPYLEIIFV